MTGRSRSRCPPADAPCSVRQASCARRSRPLLTALEPPLQVAVGVAVGAAAVEPVAAARGPASASDNRPRRPKSLTQRCTAALNGAVSSADSPAILLRYLFEARSSLRLE